MHLPDFREVCREALAGMGRLRGIRLGRVRFPRDFRGFHAVKVAPRYGRTVFICCARRLLEQGKALSRANGTANSRLWARRPPSPWPRRWPLGFSRVVASDLGRPRPRSVSSPAPARDPDKRLREQHFGQWTGKLWRDAGVDALRAVEAAGWGFSPPEGESREARLRAMHALTDAARANTGKTVLVAHQGVPGRALPSARRAYSAEEPGPSTPTGSSAWFARTASCPWTP